MKVTLREIVLPLREPFAISSGSVSTRRVLLVELLADDGARGHGECVAGELPGYAYETVDVARHALATWFVPALMDVGADALDRPLELRAVLDAVAKGHPMAKAALEMAAVQLAASRRRVSLAAYLGGTRERVEAGISLGLQATPDALVQRAQEARARGYRRIKLKIAPGRDLAFVRAVASALGGTSAPALSVDANAAYREDDPVLEALDGLGLAMIEQPLAAGALAAHGRLQARLATPICLDESVGDLDDLDSALALGAGRVLNVKPGRVGGLASALALHARAVEAGLPLWCGGMLETGIGRAFNVALASLPGFTLPNDISPSARYWHEDVVTPEWTMDADGRVTVPFDRPGLGVEVRADRLQALTRSAVTIS